LPFILAQERQTEMMSEGERERVRRERERTKRERENKERERTSERE